MLEAVRHFARACPKNAHVYSWDTKFPCYVPVSTLTRARETWDRLKNPIKAVTCTSNVCLAAEALIEAVGDGNISTGWCKQFLTLKREIDNLRGYTVADACEKKVE